MGRRWIIPLALLVLAGSCKQIYEGTRLKAVRVYDPLEDRWRRYSTMPLRLEGPACAAVGGRIYVTGGDGVKPRSRSAVLRFDPVLDTWERLEDMPTRRRFHRAVGLGNDLYVLGGMGPWRNPPWMTVDVFDTVSETWQPAPDMLLGRRQFGAAVSGGIIYAMGGVGWQNLSLDDVEAYDPGVGYWEVRTSMPVDPGPVVAEAVGTTICAVGVGTYLYDTVADVWSAGPPVSQSGISGPISGAAVVGADVYLLLEQYVENRPRHPFVSLDTIGLTWTKRAPMRGPGRRAGVASDGARIYSFGGERHKER